KLDQAAIDRVRDEVWPDPRNADELHDALVELGFITEREGEQWGELFQELKNDRRAATLSPVQDKPTPAVAVPALWIAAERLPQLSVVFPSRILQPSIAAPESVSRVEWKFDDALVEILRGR